MGDRHQGYYDTATIGLLRIILGTRWEDSRSVGFTCRTADEQAHMYTVGIVPHIMIKWGALVYITFDEAAYREQHYTQTWCLVSK